MKRALRYLVPMCIAIAALSGALVLPEVGGIDEFVRFRVSASIVERGELDFRFIEGYDDEILTVYVNPETKKTYGLWNIGQSLVLIPFVGLGKALEGLGDTEVTRGLLRGIGVSVAYCATINVLLGLAAYGTMRRLGLSGKSAAQGVIALLFCTQWLVWGHTLQEESLCALLLMVALWCGLRAANSPRAIVWAAAMGVCFGLLANVRYNAAFAAGALLLWVALMIPERKRALTVVAGAVACTLPFFAMIFWYNFTRTGDALTSPYIVNHKLMGVEYAFTLNKFWSVMFGLDNGALWFSLPLLLLPLLRRKGRDRRRLALGAALMVIAWVVHAGVLSGFYARVGVWGAGSPRLLAHQVILLGPLVWIAARRAALLARKRAMPLLRAGVLLVFVASLSMQALARSLNPELESTQDLFYELCGQKPPPPFSYLPRRFRNFKLALEGHLKDFSYPPKFGTLKGEIPRNEASEARHSMLVVPPAYFSYLRRYPAREGAPPGAPLWVYWGGAVVLFIGATLRLVLVVRRRR